MNGLVHGFSPTLGVISDRLFFGLLGEAFLALVAVVVFAIAISVIEHKNGETIGGALLSDSSGQGLLEYAIILVLVAIVIIAALLLSGPPEKLLSVAKAVYDNWPLATFIGAVIILCVAVVAIRERKRQEDEDECGQGLIEYALILILVMVVVTAAILLLGKEVTVALVLFVETNVVLIAIAFIIAVVVIIIAPPLLAAWRRNR